jgi:hypothetical protein
MKHSLTLLTLALAAATFTAKAANTDPFDFDYEIAGNVLERPALVFNDGSDTYLQPRAGQVLRVDGGHSEGPYIVVPGTPDVIHYSTGNTTATAYWKKANHFIGDKANGAGDLPMNFAGFSDRLVLVGTRSHLDSTRPLTATLPLAQLVKALVPQGWTGSAQKDIDLTASTSFATREGENWMQSLDRLIASEDLYADVDFNARHVSLRRSAPMSAAVNYVSAVVNTPTQAIQDPVAGIAATVVAKDATAAATQHDSLLALKFGALAIRDGDDTHVQVKFAEVPKDLTVVDSSGDSLRPKWDEHTHVLTIKRAERMVFSNGADKVEVARVAGTVYEFDQSNQAALQSVFDKDGATYFKFADTVGKVTVSDISHLGTGEQKGRYFKFNGVADQFIVNADGNVVSVTRRHDVQFFDRVKS